MRNHDQRGIALVTVIMILLILTVVAIAASVMMTQEDKTSGRTDLQKAALYAAETGLRRGEQVMATVPLGAVTTLLQASTTVSPPALGIQAGHVRHPQGGALSTWDATHLGTFLCSQVDPDSGTCVGAPLVNQPVPYASVGFDPGRQVRYHVLIRNNPEDSRPPSGSPLANNDFRLRILAVGVILSNNGTPLAVKVLEEEWDYGRVQESPSMQKLRDAGGSSSGKIG